MRIYILLASTVLFLSSGLLSNTHSWAADQPEETIANDLQSSEAEPLREVSDNDDSTQRLRLDQQLQELKRAILETNKDLFILEEELLFPTSTQVKVFFSMDVGDYFDLDSVAVKLDNKDIALHLYTAREIKALQRGAVQRLVTENTATGEHELVATLLGYGPQGRAYKRAVSYTFDKSTGAKYVHLKITANNKTQQPEFTFEQWD